jgi:hypothetical protein
MTRSVDAQDGRLLGRSLLTLANVITVAASVAADWNDSHIFNERWPAHARFHGVTALAMATTLSSLNIWSLWSGADRATARFFAAAVPVAYWAPFFAAPLVPGTAVEDPPHPVPRLAGMPTNLLGAAATTATAVAGWFIDRRVAALELIVKQRENRKVVQTVVFHRRPAERPFPVKTGLFRHPQRRDVVRVHGQPRPRSVSSGLAENGTVAARTG